MLRSYSNYWWVILIRGIAAVILGIIALIWTESAALALVFVFGAYVFADGVLSVISAVSNRTTYPGWWLVLFEGLAGITAGLVAFFLPEFALVVLVYLIAAWAIITGLLEIAAAIRLREEIPNEWALGLTGLLSAILGIVLVIFPASAATALVWILGIYALLFGILMIFLAFRVRSALERVSGSRGQPY